MTPAIREKALSATAKIACFSAMFISCTDEPKTESEPTDLDNDGFSVDAGDCNDDDAAVNPDAAEVCNGIDDDCSGIIDDNATDGTRQHPDEDGDGFGAGEGAKLGAPLVESLHHILRTFPKTRIEPYI